MGILNRTSDGLASVLVAIYQTLTSDGAMKRELLLEQLAPFPLCENKKNLTSPTLRRWTQFGLFEENEKGVVSIADGYRRPKSADDTLDWVRGVARELVLQRPANEDLLESEPSFGADFTRALSWSLAQDAFDFPGGPYDSGISGLEKAQVHEKPGVFQNNTRWDGFRDWACFPRLWVVGSWWSRRVRDRPRGSCRSPSGGGLRRERRTPGGCVRRVARGGFARCRSRRLPH